MSQATVARLKAASSGIRQRSRDRLAALPSLLGGQDLEDVLTPPDPRVWDLSGPIPSKRSLPQYEDFDQLPSYPSPPPKAAEPFNAERGTSLEFRADMDKRLAALSEPYRKPFVYGVFPPDDDGKRSDIANEGLLISRGEGIPESVSIQIEGSPDLEVDDFYQPSLYGLSRTPRSFTDRAVQTARSVIPLAKRVVTPTGLATVSAGLAGLGAGVSYLFSKPSKSYEELFKKPFIVESPPPTVPPANITTTSKKAATVAAGIAVGALAGKGVKEVSVALTTKTSFERALIAGGISGGIDLITDSRGSDVLISALSGASSTYFTDYLVPTSLDKYKPAISGILSTIVQTEFGSDKNVLFLFLVQLGADMSARGLSSSQ